MTPSPDERFLSDRFPRSNAYHADWVASGAMGSHVLWLTEWLTSSMQLEPGMRILDLGCGRALSSIFLAREFDVQVWATDLWISASENFRRIRDADMSDKVFPLHADARGLPYAAEFFDAITCVDAFSYFGTDDLYLNYLANFVKPGGQLGVAGAGLAKELREIPAALREMWTEDFWCLHSAPWWQHHWQRTGIVDVELADTMRDGWKVWRDWQSSAHPDNRVEIEAVSADQGQHLAYVRLIARRRPDAQLVDYCWPDALKSFPIDYEPKPLWRTPRP